MRKEYDESFQQAYIKLVSQLLREVYPKLAQVAESPASSDIHDEATGLLSLIDVALTAEPDYDFFMAMQQKLERFFGSLNLTEDNLYFRDDRDSRSKKIKEDFGPVLSLISSNAVNLEVTRRISTDSLHQQLITSQSTLEDKIRTQLELLKMFPQFYDLKQRGKKLTHVIRRQQVEVEDVSFGDAVEFDDIDLTQSINQLLQPVQLRVSDEITADELPPLSLFANQNELILDAILELRMRQLQGLAPTDDEPEGDRFITGVSILDSNLVERRLVIWKPDPKDPIVKQRTDTFNKKFKKVVLNGGLLDDQLEILNLDSVLTQTSFQKKCNQPIYILSEKVDFVENAWLKVAREIAVHPNANHMTLVRLTAEKYATSPFTHYVIDLLLTKVGVSRSFELCEEYPVDCLKDYFSEQYFKLEDVAPLCKSHHDFITHAYQRLEQLRAVHDELHANLMVQADLHSATLSAKACEGGYQYTLTSRSGRSFLYENKNGSLSSTVRHENKTYQLKQKIAEKNKKIFNNIQHLKTSATAMQQKVGDLTGELAGSTRAINEDSYRFYIRQFNSIFQLLPVANNALEEAYQASYQETLIQCEALSSLLDKVDAHNRAVSSVNEYNYHKGVLCQQPTIEGTRGLHDKLVVVEKYQFRHVASYEVAAFAPLGINETLKGKHDEAEASYYKARNEAKLIYNLKFEAYKKDSAIDPCLARIEFLQTILAKIAEAKSVVKIHSNKSAQERLETAHSKLSVSIEAYTAVQRRECDSVEDVVEVVKEIKAIDRAVILNCKILEESTDSRWRQGYDAVSTFLRGLVAKIISYYDTEDWVSSRDQKITGYMAQVLQCGLYSQRTNSEDRVIDACLATAMA